MGKFEQAATGVILMSIYGDSGMLRACSEMSAGELKSYFWNAGTLGIMSRLDTFAVPDSEAIITDVLYHRRLTGDASPVRNSVSFSTAALRVQSAWYQADPLARHGGDPFALLMRVAIECYPWDRVAEGAQDAPDTWRALIAGAFAAIDWVAIWAHLNNRPYQMA